MVSSTHPHTFTVFAPIGGARTIAPGELVSFDEVIGTDLEGAPVTLGASLTDEQRAGFAAPDAPAEPAPRVKKPKASDDDAA
jgi:hypothetical protein